MSVRGLQASIGGVPATISKTDNAVDTSDLTTYTFTSKSLGTADANRKIVVGVTTATGGALPTISSLTVAGNSASQVNTSSSTNYRTSLYEVAVASGTTGDVVVTFSGATGDCGIIVWAIYGLQSHTAVDSGISTADPGSDTLTVNAGGVGLAIASSGNALATYTWSGLTEDVDATVEAGLGHSYSGASIASSTTQNISVTATRTGGTTQQHMLTVSYR